MSIDPDLKTAIAVTRFGLGARLAGEIATASANPVAYLKNQIRPGGADQPQGQFQTGAETISGLRVLQQDRRQAALAGDAKPDPVKQAFQMIRQDAGGEFIARAALAGQTDRGLSRALGLVLVQSLHRRPEKPADQCSPAVDHSNVRAIRPHVFGRFEDMLVASTSHPGMLLYLDQAQSVGPDSQFATLGRAGIPALRNLGGLNENLAREIMELHTCWSRLQAPRPT